MHYHGNKDTMFHRGQVRGSRAQGRRTVMYISHRGNIIGPDPLRDNKVWAIEHAISDGLYCEVDVRLVNGEFWLGHDSPETVASEKLLRHPNIIAHSKDVHTLSVLLSLGVHTFWHDKDPYTLTSKGLIWAYPGCESHGTISLMPEWGLKPPMAQGFVGICSDFINDYRKQT